VSFGSSLLAAALDAELAALAGLHPELPALDAAQAAQLAEYLALVAQYGRNMGLTGLRGEVELARELGAESLRLLALGPLEPGTLTLDLGSGNGSPVIPLAIACPGADFVAVELRERRAAFLRQVRAQLGLSNLRVEEMAAQAVTPGGHGLWDAVTSRAFAPLPRLLPLAAKLLGGQGELRGYLGADTAELEPAAAGHGFRVDGLVPYELNGKPRHVYRLMRPASV
jgi:16S rRNA (guanine527-N7)-methyltransferase